MSATAAPVVSEAIVWTCDVCRGPVVDETGYVTVDYDEIHECRRREQEWEAELERRRAEQGTRFLALSLAEIPENPRPRWRVLHHACDPKPESCDYWIAVERIRTAGDVIAWTAHLLEKDWLPLTSWDDLLRRVAAQLLAGSATEARS